MWHLPWYLAVTACFPLIPYMRAVPEQWEPTVDRHRGSAISIATALLAFPQLLTLGAATSLFAHYFAHAATGSSRTAARWAANRQQGAGRGNAVQIVRDSCQLDPLHMSLHSDCNQAAAAMSQSCFCVCSSCGSSRQGSLSCSRWRAGVDGGGGRCDHQQSTPLA